MIRNCSVLHRENHATHPHLTKIDPCFVQLLEVMCIFVNGESFISTLAVGCHVPQKGLLSGVTSCTQMMEGPATGHKGDRLTHTHTRDPYVLCTGSVVKCLLCWWQCTLCFVF